MAGRIAYYGNMVRDGLVFDLDATKIDSYPKAGTIWSDISGYQNNGTLTNGPVYNSTNINGFVFDGTNDYCLVNNNPSINPPSAISVCAFVNFTGYSSNYGPLVFKQNNYQGYYEQYSIYMNNYSIGFVITGVDRNQKGVSSNGNYALQNVYIVATCDTNTDEVTLYVNGNLMATTAFTSTFDIANTPLNIGGTGVLNFGASFTGWANAKIYNVQIYNKALSQSEITQNYNVLKLRHNIQTPNLVTSGLTLLLDATYPNYISGSTTWNDLSGNNYNGTLVNGPAYDSLTKKGIIFDGTNDYVNLGNILNNVVAGTNVKYSISTWVKFNTLSNNVNYTIISKLGDSSFGEDQRQFFLMVRNLTANSYNGFQIEYAKYNSLDSSTYRLTRTVGTGLTTNTIYNICVTFDGSINTNEGLDRTNIYLNGVLMPKTLSATGGTLSNTFASGSSRVAIGAVIGQNVSNSPIALLNGEVYQTVIYNRVLSIPEVIQNFDALKERYAVVAPPINTTGLVLSLDASYPNYISGSTIWNDLSGNNNSGTLINGPTYDLYNGGSIVFDGVNDYFVSPLNKSVFTTTSQITISLTFKIITVNVGTGILQFANTLNNTVPWILLRLIDASTLSWYFINNYYLNQTISPQKYYNIVLTHDGTTWKAYNNGILESSYIGSIGSLPGSNFWIGNGYNGYSNIQVATAQVYNRALTATEISQNFNAIRGRFNI